MSTKTSDSAADLARQALGLLASANPGKDYHFLMSLNEYYSTYSPRAIELAPASTTELRLPRMYTADHERSVGNLSWSQKTPSVRAIELEHAEVMGHSDFIFLDFLCLHSSHLDFGLHLLPEEKYGIVQVLANDGLLARRALSSASVATFPAAISLVGSLSVNYAHWLTETAPKLALIDRHKDYADLPLIVDADLPVNMLLSIKTIGGNKRRLIPIKHGQVFKVERLIAITPTAFVPFEYRGGFTMNVGPETTTFVPSALHQLRERVWRRVPNRLEHQSGRQRIFFRRNSNVRKLLNTDILEKWLIDKGFVVVAPESLTFEQQIDIVRDAEIIVAPTGAALANMIFASPKCKVIVLAAASPFIAYHYFSNMAAIQGVQCAYALGEAVDGGLGEGVHWDFRVDVDVLRSAFDGFFADG